MDDREVISTLREQISNMSSLFAVSMVMLDQHEEEEVLRIAVSSVGALGKCQVEGTYLIRDGLRRGSDGSPVHVDRLTGLAGADGPVTLPDVGWAWAYPLREVGGHAGYLIVSADVEPPSDQQFVLKTLAQQAGAALHSASLHNRDLQYAVELGDVNKRLTTAVGDLEKQSRIHDRLTAAAVSGDGEAGIADALHELTGLAVAVEDRFGNLRAWSGPDRPSASRRPPVRRRTELLTEIRRHGRPMRHRDRLIALAQPRNEVLGVLTLIDPDHRAGPHELFALEHAAVVLAMELAHLRGLAETELRVRRDLVDDLLNGTDDESALIRSAALGHDLTQPHQVLVIEWHDVDGEDRLARAVERAATRILDAGSLLAHRPGQTVLIAPRPQCWGQQHHWGDLHGLIARAVRSRAGAIGVGRACTHPSELPRSHREAIRALRIRQGSASPVGVTTFDELGIYRLLADSGGTREVGEFIREWLGTLIDYDTANHSDLVTTLWQYYECGGNYDATAHALTIHRSTLRYRLRRIRELTGHDLSVVDNRLNLHVATRAWQITRARPEPTHSAQRART